MTNMFCFRRYSKCQDTAPLSMLHVILAPRTISHLPFLGTRGNLDKHVLFRKRNVKTALVSTLILAPVNI